MEAITITLPTAEQVVFTIEAEQDDTSVRGSFATGDDAQDKETEDDILERLEFTVWAWCTVEVAAKYKGMKGVTYLGACSYDDEADFKKCGYFEQMQEEALEDLHNQLLALAD